MSAISMSNPEMFDSDDNGRYGTDDPSNYVPAPTPLEIARANFLTECDRVLMLAERHGDFDGTTKASERSYVNLFENFDGWRVFKALHRAYHAAYVVSKPEPDEEPV